MYLVAWLGKFGELMMAELLVLLVELVVCFELALMADCWLAWIIIWGLEFRLQGFSWV